MDQPAPTAIEVVSAKITNNRLKALLDEKGLSQEELSRRVGVSYRHINRLALGQSAPSLLVALRIATVLEQPLEHVFSWKIVTRKRIARAA